MISSARRLWYEGLSVETSHEKMPKGHQDRHKCNAWELSDNSEWEFTVTILLTSVTHLPSPSLHTSSGHELSLSEKPVKMNMNLERNSIGNESDFQSWHSLHGKALQEETLDIIDSYMIKISLSSKIMISDSCPKMLSTTPGHWMRNARRTSRKSGSRRWPVVRDEFKKWSYGMSSEKVVDVKFSVN